MRRWRTFLAAFIIIVAFVAVAAPISVITYSQRQSTNTQLTVVCTSAKANIAQLEALADIARTLGVPVHFTVPPVPPECR